MIDESQTNNPPKIFITYAHANTKAKNKGCDIVAIFQEDHQNIPTFEKKYSVTLPPDLAASLTSKQ